MPSRVRFVWAGCVHDEWNVGWRWLDITTVCICRYFTAKSALEYGLIDRILQMPRTQALR